MKSAIKAFLIVSMLVIAGYVLNYVMTTVINPLTTEQQDTVKLFAYMDNSPSPGRCLRWRIQEECLDTLKRQQKLAESFCAIPQDFLGAAEPLPDDTAEMLREKEGWRSLYTSVLKALYKQGRANPALSHGDNLRAYHAAACPELSKLQPLVLLMTNHITYANE